MKKRLISMLLCVCMVLAYFPTAVFAAEEAGLCEHHGAHTTDCGYAAAVDGVACGHVHDTSCGYAEAVSEVLCTCTETDAAGVVMHAEGCGYVACEAGSDCGHVHDTDRGYAEPAAEQPCAYVCSDCAVTEPMGEPVTEPVAEETVAVEEGNPPDGSGRTGARLHLWHRCFCLPCNFPRPVSSTGRASVCLCREVRRAQPLVRCLRL